MPVTGAATYRRLPYGGIDGVTAFLSSALVGGRALREWPDLQAVRELNRRGVLFRGVADVSRFAAALDGSPGIAVRVRSIR